MWLRDFEGRDQVLTDAVSFLKYMILQSWISNICVSPLFVYVIRPTFIFFIVFLGSSQLHLYIRNLKGLPLWPLQNFSYIWIYISLCVGSVFNQLSYFTILHIISVDLNLLSENILLTNL